MSSIGAGKPGGSGKAVMALAAFILLLAVLLGMLIAAVAIYTLLSGPHAAPSTAITTTTAKPTTTTTTTPATTTTRPATTTTTTPETTTTVVETTTTEESTTTTLADMSEVAACMNRKGVKLFVSDACIQTRCGGIKRTFGPAFDLLNVINCDLESNEDECDNARDDVDTFGFPLWYVGSKGDYYPGASIGYIQAETGC